MSYSDSNERKRFKGVIKAFKDLKGYTSTQGQQACNALKGNELISSIKQSTEKFPGFKKNRVRLGNMKHLSLAEDDETVLWRDLDHHDEEIKANQTLSKGHPQKNQNSWDSLNGTELSFISQKESCLSPKSVLSYNSSGFGKRFKLPFTKKVI